MYSNAVDDKATVTGNGYQERADYGAKAMNHGFEFTWKNLAEASEDAARKFAWIAAGLFLACGVLAWLSVDAHLQYSQTCAYIDQYGPGIAGQQTDEGDFARVLLHRHCG